jgi:hypothetical protein
VEVPDEGNAIAIAADRHTNRFARMAGIAALALVVLVTAGYFYFGDMLIASQSQFTLPDKAALSQGTPPPPLTMPTDAELEAWFREMRGLGGGDLFQFPGDRH